MQMTLLDLFELGGWAMWPLIVFSVATVAIFLERGIVLVASNMKIANTLSDTLGAIRDGRTSDAREHLDTRRSRDRVAPVFASTIAAAALGETRMERAFETSAGKQIHTLERGLDLLVALGSIAPITGFLGTVSGMISAFNSIATAADVNAQLVAGGIFEALITTAFGLAIAIVAITGYNIIAHVVDRFATDLEEAGHELVTALIEAQ
jgi:biopolymer transport protein ExbB